jgi:hypothetical protein
MLPARLPLFVVALLTVVAAMGPPSVNAQGVPPSPPPAAGSAAAAAAPPASAAFTDELGEGNLFHEPFLRLSSALPACPAPRGPWWTAEEARKDQHGRSQSGVSCWLAGKCRLSNSYLYDPGIAERVQATFERDGRFGDTSVWVHVQRRFVTVMGCVKDEQQRGLLKATLGAVDDVVGVVDQLQVGTRASPPPYAVAPAAR